MQLIRNSPCKVNLILNILGRRPDGFHTLETLFHPVGLCDTLTFEVESDGGFGLSCDSPELPTDSRNLVHQAAIRFFETAGIQRPAVKIHLQKRLPLAAGLGGGSSNAAHTLRGLNEWFGHPLSLQQLHTIAATLGSDVNFFLQDLPALATGRGEQTQALQPLASLSGLWILLFHPGFGISTAWAYQQLAHHPEALNGLPGRAKGLAAKLSQRSPLPSGTLLFNSLEAPAFAKYPILQLFQESLRTLGALTALMSGSGSTTFALFRDEKTARSAAAKFQTEYGTAGWLEVAPLNPI